METTCFLLEIESGSSEFMRELSLINSLKDLNAPLTASRLFYSGSSFIKALITLCTA